jgi:hypothetical protein
MKTLILIIILSISFYEMHSQELVLEDGIYSEKINTKDTSLYKYTSDNISYRLKRIFIYDYYYKDKNGKFKFLRNKNSWPRGNPLNLIDADSSDVNAIDKIRINVSGYLEILNSDTNYTQTVIAYDYLNKLGQPADTICYNLKKKYPKFTKPCGDEFTGVIDNKKNVWIHPPRDYTFKILELNPFPFYYLTDSIREWAWSIETGGFYLDSRWIEHTELLKIDFKYTRLKDEILETKFGKIKCKVTNAIGVANYGTKKLKTSLKSYYHPDYGFIKLVYGNINNSKIVIELIEVQ